MQALPLIWCKDTSTFSMKIMKDTKLINVGTTYVSVFGEGFDWKADVVTQWRDGHIVGSIIEDMKNIWLSRSYGFPDVVGQ